MISAPSHAALEFLIFGVVLLHAGAFLIKWGWFPPRVGKTPHCPKCDYPLTGIETDRCRECGHFYLELKDVPVMPAQ
jgi:hypothetical protein